MIEWAIERLLPVLFSVQYTLNLSKRKHSTLLLLASVMSDYNFGQGKTLEVSFSVSVFVILPNLSLLVYLTSN